MKRDAPDVITLDASSPLGARELPPEKVVELLSPFVTPERLARFEAVLDTRTRSLVPILDGLSDPHNGAAILRSADAFGCHEVHHVRGRLPFAISTHVSRGTERWLELHGHASASACIDALEARGYELFIADMSGALTPEDLARVPRAAVVVGNEKRGVSEAFRERARGVYRIPMVGFVESLNVSVAAAITLYTASRGRHTGLDPDDRARVLARYLLAQVRDGERLVQEALTREPSEAPPQGV